MLSWRKLCLFAWHPVHVSLVFCNLRFLALLACKESPHHGDALRSMSDVCYKLCLRLLHTCAAALPSMPGLQGYRANSRRAAQTGEKNSHAHFGVGIALACKNEIPKRATQSIIHIDVAHVCCSRAVICSASHCMGQQASTPGPTLYTQNARPQMRAPNKGPNKRQPSAYASGMLQPQDTHITAYAHVLMCTHCR